jgi:flagellar basal-body rod protein FlgB
LNILQSGAKELLTQAMDASVLRNQVLANNIANVDTPGFKRQEVLFEDLLSTQISQLEDAPVLPLRLTHNRHMGLQQQQLLPLTPRVREIDELTYRNDGNNVDFDLESTKIAENKLLYDAYVQCYNNEQKLLRTAITGRSS